MALNCFDFLMLSRCLDTDYDCCRSTYKSILKRLLEVRSRGLNLGAVAALLFDMLR